MQIERDPRSVPGFSSSSAGGTVSQGQKEASKGLLAEKWHDQNCSLGQLFCLQHRELIERGQNGGREISSLINAIVQMQDDEA